MTVSCRASRSSRRRSSAGHDARSMWLVIIQGWVVLARGRDCFQVVHPPAGSFRSVPFARALPLRPSITTFPVKVSRGGGYKSEMCIGLWQTYATVREIGRSSGIVCSAGRSPRPRFRPSKFQRVRTGTGGRSECRAATFQPGMV